MPSAAMTMSASATAPLANDTRADLAGLLEAGAAMSGMHHACRQCASPATRRDRRGACRTSRSSPQNPSPGPGLSAPRHGGNSANRGRPWRPIVPPTVRGPPAANAARCSASGIPLPQPRRAQGPAHRRKHREPWAISAFAANRPPIPPPTTATWGRFSAIINSSAPEQGPTQCCIRIKPIAVLPS